ncbi:MAG: GDSL family lipase [Oscillospiraceae bacterium]|nr:GDSL family lipase [Oscillospiraceae bacterium]
MKQIFRKLTAAAASLAVSASLAVLLPSASLTASAASDYWKFDFGAGGVANGYTGVSASDGYNAGRGYGFSNGTNVSNVGASGGGALSDAVRFNNSTPTGGYTFCADVPNGLYQVSVWLGDTNRTSVAIEGMYQIMNLTGNNAYHTLQVPVSDGQLNICACEGKAGYAFTMSALEIKKISDEAKTNPTIWVCGDSTVCNYYPLDSSAQAGWAQMLPQFIDNSKWQVMNMAASGQCARGFLDAGQFTVIEKNGQPGDIYVISIGINDTNEKNNTTEAQYAALITDMAQRAMQKGMRVILVQQQGRNGDCQRSPLLTGRWYNDALATVGQQLNLEVVNLFKLWQDYCLTKSANEVNGLYMENDGLHPNRQGATVLAKFMADAINSGSSDPGTNPGTDPGTTPVITTEDPLLQGDLDSDSALTAKDLTLMKRIVIGANASYSILQAADLNSDFKADSADLVLLAKYLSGQDAAFADPKYAATEQTIVNGWHEETNAGYAYKDYLNLDNSTASSVTFSVKAPQDGNYLCTFRIANGSANDRQMTVSVDTSDKVWKQSFLTTGAWTTWENRGLVLPLKAGINRITLKSDTSEGGPNFDYMEMSFTDEPIAQPYDGSSQPSQTVTSDKPVVYVASDSTAQSYNASYAPQQGWGYYLQDYFTDNVQVSNHSIAGRSSKSFYDNGRLQAILDQIKEGDYLIVCFGINDGAYNKEERYAPVCNNVDNPTQGSFEYYMTFYIKGALDKGATPILMCPTLSIKGAQQPFGAGYRNIDSACQALARKYNVPYFDLSAAMANDFNNRPYDTVYGYYMGSTTQNGTDFTHFTETGAKVTAGIICNGIKNLNIPLSQYVK